MSVTDGIELNGKHSYRDFGLCIESSVISPPMRKKVTQTVPFMNGYYDFSDIGGKVFYESRTIKYSFEIIEDNIQNLEKEKNKICSWLETASQSEIYDDADPDHHFIGSTDSIDWQPDGENYGLITETFLCQPFRIKEDGTEEI